MVHGYTADSPAVPWQSGDDQGIINITVHSPDKYEGEPIHPGNSIEWWFVHGSFQGPSVTSRHFMASIFRYDLSRNKSAADNGFYCIISVLDPATAENSVISRGEHRILEQLFIQGNYARSTNLDRDLVTAYIEELRAYGPPGPVTLDDSQPLITHDPFSFIWDDINLKVSGDGIFLSFGNAGDSGQCRFQLTWQSARYCMENVGTSPENSMTYVTRPRLRLSGRYGDDQVSGTAWFDHQWGNSGWFLAKSGERNVQGWDWAGISGTDGTSWIFLVFRDHVKGTVLGKQAFMFGKGGEINSFPEFDVRTLRTWTSPATRVQYPVAMEVSVPDAKVRFIIEPVTEAQEIPVLGFMRAVWEGAATVSGFFRDRPFTGTARLELYGYGYIFDFQHYLGTHIRRIHESIDGFISQALSDEDSMKLIGITGDFHNSPALNETIIKPCRDLLSREKKYWRPVFALLLLETLGIPSGKYQQLLSVVPELTHTGTLIIDDIEDNGEVRRGDICIHHRYGTDVAINAANTLYFLPSVLFKIYPDLTDSQRLDLYRIYLDSFVRGHLGQAQDIWWTKNLSEKALALWTQDHLTEKILQMYDFKTATAAVAIAETGCILAKSTPRVRDACVHLARVLGTAFQITDDIQSFEPCSGEIHCDDIQAGKLTYVIAQALLLLAGEDKKRLIQILCSPEKRQQQELVKEGIALVRKSGALERCCAEAREMVDDAWHLFSKNVPPSEPKVMLRLFIKNLITPGKNRTV